MTEDNDEKKMQGRFKPIISIVKLAAVVVGVVVSVRSFNETRDADAAARDMETKKAFLELRQKTYLEAVQVAALLSTPDGRTKEELSKAKQRFAELYVAELSLVESRSVEGAMIDLAGDVDPELRDPTKAQTAAIRLAHALRDSLVESWGISTTVVDNPHK
jgi:hypothetical protein